MKLIFKLQIVMLLFGFNLLMSQTSKWEAPTSLPESFFKLKDSLAPKARLGLAVYSLKHEKFIYEINSSQKFRPASTLKLLVTAAALDTFSLDYYPQTQIKLDGKLKGKHFYGDLTLIGGGDPNISARYYADPLGVLRSWIDTLKKDGIDSLSGRILLDTSFIKDPRRPNTWENRFFDSWYGAEISALTYNDNCILMKIAPPEYSDNEKIKISKNNNFSDTVAIRFNPEIDIYHVNKDSAKVNNSRRNRIKIVLHGDSNIVNVSKTISYKSREYGHTIPVRDPKEFFKQAFIAAMDSNSLFYDSSWIQTKVGEIDSTIDKIKMKGEYSFQTVPILSLLDEINQRSQNLHAELLLRHLGFQYFGEASLENGIKAEQEFLNRWGLDTSEFVLLDGSGLSYGNRVTPQNMSLLLKEMARHPHKNHYMNSLGLPGISGASAKRMREIEAAHKTRVKTGFVNNTQGLSGYILTSDDDTLAVALYLNEYKVRDNVAKSLMDTMWTQLTDLHNMEHQDLIKARKQWYSGSEIKDINERIEYFSKLQLGVPYQGDGPMGEGALARVERKPRINMSGFDCVTYIEHVMALSYAKTPSDVLNILDSIRYHQAKAVYQSRNHFFVEDWLKNNTKHTELLRFENDTTAMRVSDKKWFYKLKNIEYDQENPQTELSFLSYDNALELAKNWSLDDGIYGVGYIGGFDKLWVTHTGFISRQNQQDPIFRHASLNKEIVEETFLDYLIRRKGKVKGVIVWRFLDK